MHTATERALVAWISASHTARNIVRAESYGEQIDFPKGGTERRDACWAARRIDREYIDVRELSGLQVCAAINDLNARLIDGTLTEETVIDLTANRS
jgi:hypothetical protein